ncbi:MAG: protein kinase [Elusimicrobiaceae bacterium]|nr:protein kinase [Elusimicrobiaceae bacterium]
MKENPSLVGQVISGCEILEKTAEGGMGSVYKARHRALDRIVCVKILSPALSEDKKAVELFLTEARAIAQLDHPNIVNVYNVGKESGYYFIVMSFIEGQTLSAKLKKEKVIPVNVVLDLFDGVLQGLAAAHEKGIIHRDIKPSNILITPQGQAKLVDFGIAKKVNKTGSAKTTELAGTAYFIAPEQALGSNLDTRADLYSIGASMYYVLTGHFPYNGKNTIDIIQKHINNPVPDPSTLRKGLPGWLVQMIQKLMAKNPDDRFQTAKEVGAFIRKMRAEEQLRLKANPKHAIDVAEQGPRLVIQEDLKTTTRTSRKGLTQKPAEEVSQPQNVLMPQINESPRVEENKPARKKRATPEANVAMPHAEDVKPVSMYTPAPRRATREQSKLLLLAKENLKKLFSLVIFLPLFAVFAGIVIYTFYQLGHICSGHITEPSARLIQDIIAPFVAANYAPNQLLYIGICIVVLALIFASSVIKAFSRSTATLLFLAATSFLAGLFTPDLPFMELDYIAGNLFSPEYFLCYFILAFVWALSICFTINRSFCQGILGASLVLLAVLTAFLSAHLSIAPNQQDVFFTALLYASLFCGLCTIFYLLSRSSKDTAILPAFLLILAVAGIWTYTVSGLTVSLRDTANVLLARVQVKPSTVNNNLSGIGLEKEFLTTREHFQKIDRTNELTGISDKESLAVLGARIEKAVPGVFDENMKPFFADLLADYYRGGGKDPMKMRIWEYALTLPIRNFNNDARENDAYFFLIAMLYIFGLANCAGAILFKEDL